MAYQVIARKWRPQKFSDMVGQEHLARTLKNAIRTGRIAQAYLFVGPRGIGKTTTARIFAKALNCEHPVDGEPCCECASCKAIASESSVDVIEIDAATHTQVDKAREICEEVMHLPIASKYKIYIIDEVHMLSKSAWNALLKTIEEPPAHAKFIFATTEVNKVLPTVISRCQRFDLKRIPTILIADRLEMIAKSEGVPISRAALDVIARAADGGMRDAQSLLDQMISFFGTEDKKEISEEQALSLFGLTAPEEMTKLVRAMIRNDKASVILSIHAFSEIGKNLEVLFDEILSWLRGILLCSIVPNPEEVLEENPETIAVFKELGKITKIESVQRLLEQLSSTGYLLREAINKQVFIETLLIKSMRMAHAVQVNDLIERLNYIRRTGELGPLENIPVQTVLPEPDIKKNDFVRPPAAKVILPGPKAEVIPPSAPKTEIPVPKDEPKAEVIPPSAPKTEIPVPKDEPKAEMIPPSAPKIEPKAEVIPPPVPVVETAKNEAPAEEDDAPPMPRESEMNRYSEVSEDDFSEGNVDSSSGESAVEDSLESPSRNRKSVEELKKEIEDLPILKDTLDLFGGSIVDVHEISTEK